MFTARFTNTKGLDTTVQYDPTTETLTEDGEEIIGLVFDHDPEAFIRECEYWATKKGCTVVIKRA